MAINIRNGKQCSVCAVKRSRPRLRCGQAVKQQKWWSKYFDPGRSCDYSAYGNDHPLISLAPRPLPLCWSWFVFIPEVEEGKKDGEGLGTLVTRCEHKIYTNQITAQRSVTWVLISQLQQKITRCNSTVKTLPDPFLSCGMGCGHARLWLGVASFQGPT